MKDIIKSLISLKQNNIPTDFIERELRLPTDSGKIVAVIGGRRCGKSTLMELAINRLLASGIEKEAIVWIGFDDERLNGMTINDFDLILSAYREMFPERKIRDTYFFFDEIQRIGGWELFIMRLYKSYTKHIFLSGSNSEMLSSEIATELRGWPLEYREYPLSFREYCRFTGMKTDSFLEEDMARLVTAFNTYNSEGGYPEVTLQNDRSIKTKILQGYFNTMIFQDLMERYHLTNPERIKYVLKRLMAGISKPASINAIYNDIKSQGLKVSKDDLYDIADKACSIFLLFKVQKFDKSLAKENNSLPKYYCIDGGLRQNLLKPTSEDNGKLLENAVFLHLNRNLSDDGKISYHMNDGKGIRRTECDFVVQERDEVSSLVQACWDMNEATREREIEGIVNASEETGCTEMTIVTYDHEEIIATDRGIINVVPAWKWFLRNG